MVLDDGNIQIIHGESSEAGSGGEFVVLDEDIELPEFATEAAVFLNGWSLEYLDDDNHINVLGTYVENSRVAGGRLRWRAGGLLQDKGGDDSFEWRYFYTVVAWNSQVIRCNADHNDLQQSTNSELTTRLPVVSSAGTFQRGGLRPPFSVVLPRGFVYFSSDLDDHHLLHLGYNLIHSANARLDHSMDSDGAGTVGAGVTSWDTHAIMQDNTYRRFLFFNWHSTIAGSGVSIVQPPFTILPTRVGLEIGSPATVNGHKSREIRIQGVPFDVAVPVLAGWDLRYDFDDEHVRKMGVWLDDFDYEPPTRPGRTGTLTCRVTSALYDNDKDPGFASNVNIHILGFTESQINE